MKLSLLPLLTGLSGRLGKLVFCIEKSSGACWTRYYVYPELTEHNHNIGSVGKNMSIIYHSANIGYIEDLKNYVDRYNLSGFGSNGRLRAFTCFTKMLYNLKKSHESVNLKTLTIEQIMNDDLPVRSIKEAIDNQLLPAVSRYQELNVLIV